MKQDINDDWLKKSFEEETITDNGFSTLVMKKVKRHQRHNTIINGSLILSIMAIVGYFIMTIWGLWFDNNSVELVKIPNNNDMLYLGVTLLLLMIIPIIEEGNTE